MESILISILYLMLHIAVIIFVAFIIVWVFKLVGYPIDPDVYKVGKIIVILLIVIAVVTWAFSIIGYGPGLPYGPRVSYGGTPSICRGC